MPDGLPSSLTWLNAVKSFAGEVITGALSELHFMNIKEERNANKMILILEKPVGIGVIYFVYYALREL
jgi:selenophosphate synthase